MLYALAVILMARLALGMTVRFLVEHTAETVSRKYVAKGADLR